ncbi:lymphotoxin-alpha-like [Scyliorhinus torazame]|uniref:Tumor necrosis factor n=1 Tax=Scyliorhinus torazame TaxID=75743 RepID=A0A401QBH4_SCYTO|nr:hypothetical protein [Scyliorhinus torazame]
MNSENKLLDLESGAAVVLREWEPKRSCFWQSLCAVAVLGLLAVSSYLLLCQLGVLPSMQDREVKFDTSDMAASKSRGLPHLLKQVGSDRTGRIAAHLTASPTSKGKNVIWQNETDSTFTHGVEFSDNRLIIETPGQYFVYTQVVFHSRGCQDQAVYLSHNVAKLSPSYPEEEVLLKATKSACHYGKHGDPWYKTSYQGAIFEFEEGDEVFSRVNVDVAGYVDTTTGKSFFGIFAV